MYYPLTCSGGYGFKADVDEVYGFCTGTGDDGNTYMIHDSVSDASCYGMFDIKITDIDSHDTSFKYLKNVPEK